MHNRHLNSPAAHRLAAIARMFRKLWTEPRLVAGLPASPHAKPITDRRSALPPIQAVCGISRPIPHSRFPRRPSSVLRLLSAFILALGPVTAALPVEPDFTAMSLEDLGNIKVDKVYAASKHAQSLADAPASVNIVTAQDIQQYGYRTLAEILNSLPGFYVTSDRANNFLGVRGFNRPGDYGGRNLLMVDGHRLNEAVHDNTSFGRDFVLDVDLIDRVEVVRGPGSALYGNNAFFSIINVIPKRGRDYNWGEVSAGGGNYDSYQGRFTVGKQFTNGLELLLSGTYYASQGEERIHYVSADPDLPFPNGGVAENRDGERAYSFFTQLRYGDFTLAGAYASHEIAESSAPYFSSRGAVFNDPLPQTTDTPAYVDLKFERQFADDWSVFARAGYNHYTYDTLRHFDYYHTGDPADYTINLDQSHSQAVDAEVQVSKTLFDRHVLTAGTEFRDLFDNFYQNEDLNPAYTYTSINSHQLTWGVFANAEVQLYRTNLTLHAGLRYDGFSEFDPAFSPRAALIARPWATTTFKFIYGQAYRTPNIYEFTYDSTHGGGAPPTPETIRSYELVWDQALGQHFRSGVSAYLNQINNLIDYNSTQDRYVNFSSVESRGLEFELEGRAHSGLRGRISYALQETQDTITNQKLSNSPEHLAKVNLAVPLYQNKLFAGLELQYHSAVTGLSAYGPNEINDFWLLNATLFSQKILPGLEFSASVKNLLDTDYAFPGTPNHSQAEIPQLGRSLWFKFTYKF